MTDIVYHEIAYGVDTTETLKKLILTRLGFYIQNREEVNEFFKKHRFFTKLEDYRSITDNFIILQSLRQDSILVSTIDFIRTNEGLGKRVLFKANITFEELSDKQTPYCGLMAYAKKNQALSLSKAEPTTTPSAFFIKNLMAYHAVRRKVKDKLLVVENTFMLLHACASKEYEITL